MSNLNEWLLSGNSFGGNRERFESRRHVANLLRVSNRKVNVFRWGVNETDAHINRKFEICKVLKKIGHHFYTEAIFKSGLRADVIDADECVAYEVYSTESSDSLKKKRKNYPIEVRFIDANEEFYEDMIF